jgi:molybdopterin-guanine dinucleotide biosynthesis adapter protein
MMPAVAFVGASQCGKTTLIERLIPELAGRGWRTAVIKHSGHTVALDMPGKDSARFTTCGGDPVVVASDDTALVRQRGTPIEVDALLRLVENRADAALVEGFRRSALPRIEVHRKSVSAGSPVSHEALLAVVTDEPLKVNVPQFGFDDIAGVAALLARHFERTSGDDVRALVNGKPLFLKPFMQLLIARTTLGMMSAMKGAGEIRTLELHIDNTRGKWGAKRESRDTDGQ